MTTLTQPIEQIEVGVDECLRCSAPMAVGRDYCDGCDTLLKAAVAKGECLICKDKLPAETGGYCPSCGASLINPPAMSLPR